MNKRLRILSIIVMTYMLAALCWWAVLLHRKNADNFRLESKLLVERFLNDANIPTVDVTTLPEYAELKAKYERQIIMISSEAVVFGVVLVIGIFFINRAFNRELAIAEKQKNFLLSITHELKSPLASINLILDTFIKRDLPKEKVQELSKDALQESPRLNDLFNKILLATTNGIVKTMDSEAIVSVLHNLLENAIKYNKNVPKIEISLKKQADSALLHVADNGIGISADERTKVMDQFYRVGSEDTRTAKGTGLGLYIVREIIRAHNGKIKIGDSSLGGTAFDIYI